MLRKREKTMRQVTLTVDREAFDTAVRSLTEDEVEFLVVKHPSLFRDCYTIAEAGEPATEATPEKPAPPKVSAEDRATIKRKLMLAVSQKPDQRAEEYAKMVGH